jgi:hypothetical protein
LSPSAYVPPIDPVKEKKFTDGKIIPKVRHKQPMQVGIQTKDNSMNLFLALLAQHFTKSEMHATNSTPIGLPKLRFAAHAKANTFTVLSTNAVQIQLHDSLPRGYNQHWRDVD